LTASGIRIGRIFGIPIFLHGSWFIVFALITFSLTEHFAGQHPEWTKIQHWVVGVATSLLFFGSVLFHELGHSVVAQHYKVPVVSITLFVFGGLARIGREPENARQEFNIAVAGPVSSYLLAGGFYLLTSLFPQKEMLGALAGWLWMINFALATFNLIPGFPLDGGRILRAMVWGITKNYSRATRMASFTGQGLAYLMILLGIWQALTGGFFNGMWLAFIGWFVLTAAQESYMQLAVRNTLAGIRAGDVMSREVPTVERSASLDEYVQELLRTGRRCHLVMDGERMVGMMTVHALNRVPRDDWNLTSVQGAMLSLEQVHLARPEESLLGILERMQSEDVNQMPVVSDGRVVGLVTRESILRIIQTRLEVGDLNRA
jgi:Zn-dependent protease